MNKETIISKLKETEYQVRRLRALIHLDDDNVLSTEEDIRKGLHCCFKARNELHSIINELRTGLLGINTKENQEMGLYDDISNPMIKEPEYTDADIKVLNPDYNSAAEVINDWKQAHDRFNEKYKEQLQVIGDKLSGSVGESEEKELKNVFVDNDEDFKKQNQLIINIEGGTFKAYQRGLERERMNKQIFTDRICKYCNKESGGHTKWCPEYKPE